MQIIPAVDVLDGHVVRLRHGDFARVTVYADDPVAAALRWQHAGAALVHVVDLEGARSGSPNRVLWTSMAAAGVEFQVGGGIRSAGVAQEALEAGALRVVLGTAAVWNPSVLASVGAPNRVVAAVDVRGDRAQGSGWLDEGRLVDVVLEELARRDIGIVLLTGIGRDGTLDGPDTELMASVVADGRFAVIASGGVGSLTDISDLAAIGCDAAVVGTALYEGAFTLSEAMAAAGS